MMSENVEIETACRTICSLVLGVVDEELDSLDRATDDRWTSLRHVEILLAVEEEFGVILDPLQFAGVVTVRDLVDAVKGAGESGNE